MPHIMLDIETLGQVPGSAIISIGAIEFNPYTNELGDKFYDVISRQSCKDFGLTEDQETLDWWNKQSPEACIAFDEAQNPETSKDLAYVLTLFNLFIERYSREKEPVFVWGNGADFDNVLIVNAFVAAAMHKCDLKPHWKFWNNRCYRTIKSLKPTVKLERKGTFHNALDDAMSQAIHLQQITQNLGLQF